MNQEGGPGDEGGSGRGQGPRRVHQGVWDRQGVGSPRTALGSSPAQIRQGQRLHGGVVGLPEGKQGPGQTGRAPQEGLMEGWGLGVCSMGTWAG